MIPYFDSVQGKPTLKFFSHPDSSRCFCFRGGRGDQLIQPAMEGSNLQTGDLPMQKRVARTSWIPVGILRSSFADLFSRLQTEVVVTPSRVGKWVESPDDSVDPSPSLRWCWVGLWNIPNNVFLNYNSFNRSDMMNGQGMKTTRRATLGIVGH